MKQKSTAHAAAMQLITLIANPSHDLSRVSLQSLIGSVDDDTLCAGHHIGHKETQDDDNQGHKASVQSRVSRGWRSKCHLKHWMAPLSSVRCVCVCVCLTVVQFL